MNGDRILLVEDDKEIWKDVEIFLKGQGYTIFQAADGVGGLEMLEERETDLAIVDVMMPRVDGVTITIKLHEKYDLPVIFLSTESEEADRILGLNMGADDCATKPFTPTELVARASSQLQRYHRSLSRLSSKQTENPKVYRLRGLEVNEETVEAIVDDKAVKVTPIEFRVLSLLIQNPGRVSPAEEIYERVRNERAANTDTAMIYIRNLREKAEMNPRKPKYIKVVWGVGYKIEKQP